MHLSLHGNILEVSFTSSTVGMVRERVTLRYFGDFGDFGSGLVTLTNQALCLSGVHQTCTTLRTNGMYQGVCVINQALLRLLPKHLRRLNICVINQTLLRLLLTHLRRLNIELSLRHCVCLPYLHGCNCKCNCRPIVFTQSPTTRFTTMETTVRSLPFCGFVPATREDYRAQLR